MAQFTYKARRRTGELVEGVLDAHDRSAALVQLERSGLSTFSLTTAAAPAVKSGRLFRRGTAVTEGESVDAGGANALPATMRGLFKRQRKPSLQELATYTQQLSNLLRAGMPLTGALRSMASLSSRGIPQYVSDQLKQDVIEGRGLSDAMQRQGHVFPDLVINMVRAGEHSGALQEVLRRLASHYERFAEVQAKFKSSMIYPMVVMSVGVLLVFFFMTVMMPQFSSFFESMNMGEDRMPTSTKLLIGASNFMKRYWWLFPVGGIMTWLVVRRYAATAGGRRRLDAFKMRAPVLGGVVRLNLFAQFARTLATLLQNGVPVLSALKITEAVVPNSIVRDAIAATRDAVTDGKTLAQPLAQAGIFPQLMIDLIRIGEETGDVPASLNNLAETYESDLGIALRTMTNLIEPVLIVGIALVVGFLLISVMQAMFAITSSIQGGAGR